MSLSFEVWPVDAYRDGAGTQGEAVLRTLLPGRESDWSVYKPEDDELIVETAPCWVATRSRDRRYDRLELRGESEASEGWHLACASSVADNTPPWRYRVQLAAWTAASAAPFVAPLVVLGVFGRRLPWYVTLSIAAALSAGALAGLWCALLWQGQVASKAHTAATRELAASVLAAADAGGRFGLRPRAPDGSQGQ